MMRSILLKQFGGIENLIVGQVAKPIPKNNEILVQVKSFALNRADILQRLGRYPPPPGDSEILGLEMSGIVVEADKNGHYKKGDPVFGIVGGGAYGEYCTIAANQAFPKPEHLTFEQASAIPEAWLTAYQALHPLSNYQRGQSAMIHAAAGGVGTALVQLCRAAGAPLIFGTVGSDEKADFIKKLGCTHPINYKTQENFLEVVQQVTNKKGVNRIFDYVGAKYWNQNLKSMSLDGVMIIQGILSGSHIKETADITPILSKRLTIIGSTLRNRSNDYKADLVSGFTKDYLHLFETGELKPVIDRVFSYNEIQDAHKYLETNQAKGKVVVNSFNH
ncbi:hypothetical protein DICPUDRAFT_157395 [Dictyostelium purpureum]|uniref:Enoyl reductase (ER) domain-containing protein n=1 Tax=Dictyostelium purpureum TaxID=5786 RepID=F0ZZ11_DICPU|nr:uncharacterized protein DICPUDRAFT_157395 [Dictyostelium purpureum]EGC30819.1 hypothetical protein DICPUDRAFT_157395 [Dictyostelium purpureum]|eukprot:XP_003292662.1 hypothetical protein DICPUDRAFT_157395 [Dictyostelium purpureum]